MKPKELETFVEKPLLIIESLGSKRTLSLNYPLFSIGRHPQCSLVLQDPMLSPHHATIAWLKARNCSNNSSYWIIDGKGSRLPHRNGIFVNGSPTFLHRLRSDDVISFGSDTMITYTSLADLIRHLSVPKNVYSL